MRTRAVSAPRPFRVAVEHDVEIRLRDGVRTYADVYRPDDVGPHPVVLHRTPYNKGLPAISQGSLDPIRAAGEGFVSVVQDVRGRFTSEGDFDPYRQEIDDGHDSIEWCAAQPWSDGRIGTIGASYAGMNQLLAATTRPPHLRCVVPLITASDLYEGWTYAGGALQLGFLLTWTYPNLAAEAALNRRFGTDGTPELHERLRAAVADLPGRWSTLPLGDQPLLRQLTPYLLEWLAHPARDEHWQALSVQERYADIEVPALCVGGWYDIFVTGTLRNFAGLRARAGTAEAREGTRLLVGPWLHAMPTSNAVGALDFGLAAGQGAAAVGYDVEQEYLDFLRRWLQPKRAAEIGDEPRVRLFTMGENRWRDEAEWPLARTRWERWYLRSGGHANTSAGDGALSTDGPGEGEAADRFTYDPADPVPTRGGALCCYPAQLPYGPMDQADVETRADVLVYRSAPLAAPLELTGPVTLELHASTSAPDTDFTAKLVHVHADGGVVNLADGIVRARFREGTDRELPVPSAEPLLYTIEVGPTSILLDAGDRIGLEVSSSNFPRFDRNPNTGAPLGADAELRPAEQTVWHDALRPSCLVLPVIPR